MPCFSNLVFCCASWFLLISVSGTCHALRHLHGDDPPLGANLSFGRQARRDHDLSALYFLCSCSNLQRHSERCGAQIIHVKRCGDKSRQRNRLQVSIFGSMLCRRSRTGTVTVDERGDQASVDIPGDTCVICSRFEDGNCFGAVPIALYLQTVLVEPTAAVAVTQLIRV